MGIFLSCFTRPHIQSTFTPQNPATSHHNHQSTPISHPYPLAARQRGMSEYRPSPPHPTTPHSPTKKHHTPSTTTSRCSSPNQRPMRGPKRVHEIPFPLLLSTSSASAPSSPHILSPASSLRPLAPTPRVPRQIDVGSIGSISARRKLRKVQVVDGGWELWREDDWGGYGVASKPDPAPAELTSATDQEANRGYTEGEIIPMSSSVNLNGGMGSGIDRGMRDLSGDSIGAERAAPEQVDA